MIGLTRSGNGRGHAATLPDGQFRADVLEGLAVEPKRLPCKYFYDAAGSRLFEQITALDEYYLTRTEHAIMRRHAREMADVLGPRCLVVEYGSGSSSKTRILLDHLVGPAGYVPVDIARGHLLHSAEALRREYPELEVVPVHADFTQAFAVPARLVRKTANRLIYFPGSTIGNFTPDEAAALLRSSIEVLGGGGLLLGADLQKDPRVLEEAYNDRRGLTAAFNRNLLVRINRELGANFAVDQFAHRALYNAEKRRIEMHLVSRCAQRVDMTPGEFFFAPGESILTEFSYKYSLRDLHELAAAAGLAVRHIWTDRANYFSVSHLK